MARFGSRTRSAVSTGGASRTRNISNDLAVCLRQAVAAPASRRADRVEWQFLRVQESGQVS